MGQQRAITGIQGEMMSAYANSLQKPERFDMYVRKFRSICAMHGVPIGSPTELPGFLRKLLEDRRLAMDFWAFIGKLSNREGGELSDDQLIGVVVEGVTDSEFSLEDGGQEQTIDDLRSMLAGVDIQNPEQSPVEMAPFPPNKGGSDRSDEQRTTTYSAEFTHKEGEVDHASALPATPFPQLDEARLRLELSRLVQQYFDNIDKRISKLEPRPEETISMGTIANAVTRRSLEDPSTEDEVEELRLRRMGRTRLVLEPIPLPVERSLEAKEDDLPIHIPLEHYSPPTRFGRAPLMLLLVLLGAGYAIYRDPTLLRQGYATVARQFRSEGAVAPVPKPRTLLPPSPGQNANIQQSQSSAAPSAPENTSTPPPADTSNQVASVGSKTGDNNPDSSSNQIADRVLVQTEQALADGISAAGAVKVNPAVMDENLIVSRVPAYPPLAKMSRIQGDVIMQALISKEGTVKRVHVTEGDSRLRSAAEDAVYKWRYRPYVLNGQPVEVATTVTVNFKLNR